jgi:hypothetical protein
MGCRGGGGGFVCGRRCPARYRFGGRPGAGGGSKLPSATREGMPQASGAVMASLLDLCGKASTKACAFSAGTPAATTAKWNKLLRLVSKHPVNLGSQQGVFTYADVVTYGVDLGSVAQWQSSAALLQQLWTVANGGTPAPSPTPSPSPAPPPPSGPSYYSGTEQ